MLGGNDPGHVTWAPDVFDKAAEYGLVLLENGSLVDTTLGETIPDGQSPMPATTAEQVAAHRILDANDVAQCVYRVNEQCEQAGSSLNLFADRHIAW